MQRRRSIEIKRFFVFCLTLCLLLLTACGQEKSDPNVYDVEYGGKTYTVDQINRTITVDGYTCRFQVTGSGNSTKFEVTYPDGSTYFMHWSGYSGSGGGSDDYDPERYVSGDTLWEVLEQDRPGTRSNKTHAGLGIFLLMFGIVEAVFPRGSWWLSHGWRYKNAEPSDLALGLGRTTGIIMILAGIICFFV